MFKWVASRHEGVVGCVVGWVKELPVGGKWSVLGFELYRHGLNLFLSEFILSVVWLSLVFGFGCGHCSFVVACNLSPDVFWLVQFFVSWGSVWGGS